MFHVYKLYNTKHENRAVIKVLASKGSKKQAINEVIKMHSQVLRGHNKPSNWIVEKVITEGETPYIDNPNQRPKAKSKKLMKSK